MRLQCLIDEHGLVALKPEELYRYVQTILRENQVEFFVSPYSAWPQVWVHTSLVLNQTDRVPLVILL